MLHPEVLDRVIAFSGMYPLGERTGTTALTGSRILALNGDTDPMAPLGGVTELMAELNRQGATVEQVLRPGGHGIEPTDLDAARNWLSSNG
ncbi:putative esterase [Arthrobacter sp. UYCu712]